MSTGAIIASFVVGTVGFGLFLYGKNEARLPQLAVGLVMMSYPYFVSNVAVTWAIGCALVLGLVGALRAGA